MQRVLSTLLSREVKDPRVGNVTVTAVNVAPDMSQRARLLRALRRQAHAR